MTAILVCFLTLAGAFPMPQDAEKTKGGPPPGTVAVISGRPLSDAELEEIGKDRLAKVKAEELNLKRQILEDYIVKRLLEDEAKARGITVTALEKAEIEGKILPVSDEQKRAVYEMMPQSYAGKPEAEAFKQIEANLKMVRLAEAKKTFLAALRKKGGVQILIEAPKIVISAGAADDPSLGPAGAPVNLVVFSDFQCPFCARAFPTIKQLEARYKDKLRIVFKDFPLNIHPQAAKAAEGGACANEQGKFWEYHDKLFENPRALQVTDLKRVAQGIGLNARQFNECIDSTKYVYEWQADQAEGEKLGVSGTPTFFANGRMIVGAKSFEEMSKVIEEELAKSGGDK